MPLHHSLSLETKLRKKVTSTFFSQTKSHSSRDEPVKIVSTTAVPSGSSEYSSGQTSADGNVEVHAASEPLAALLGCSGRCSGIWQHNEFVEDTRRKVYLARNDKSTPNMNKCTANVTIPPQTYAGTPPLVIARGGFSGLFPGSSYNAYQFALETSVPDVILWCDVQLTKDGVGICLPDLRLDYVSNAALVFKNKRSTYIVNGVSMQGWFPVDFTLNDLANVFCELDPNRTYKFVSSCTVIQNIYSRTNLFDQSQLQILRVEDVAQLKPPGLWLNIQHDAFFSQHNLSMRSFVISTSRSVIVNYISSPEVNFLRSIVTRFRPSTTKLVFRFLGQDNIEPSTNQSYGSLLKNLTFVKTFAAGILVPKSYIWPVDSLYLQPHTSVVLDAHKEGLEVFASEFANDVPFAYNYSYDPVAEYTSFVDNGNFSVDGVLSDFPITPSEAIDCFSHIGKNTSGKENLLVISNEGASGDYPGCTDLAYVKAISDGVDILDCPVQMTSDGIPFCLGSINLIDRTTVVQSNYSSLTASIPGLGDGIFTFNLTWSQIQSLHRKLKLLFLAALLLVVEALQLYLTSPVIGMLRIPMFTSAQDYMKIKPVNLWVYDRLRKKALAAIRTPYPDSDLYRNPSYKNAGKIIALSEFLMLANNATSITGVLIRVENAAYLATQGLSVIGAVQDALANNQTVKKVMIRSTNSSVLKSFKEHSSYELVYEVDENIRDALNSTILDIKKFASSVVISKDSLFPRNVGFLTVLTDISSRLQAFKVPVYVQLFSNEFLSQAWDFFADAYVEINSFAMAGINGVISDFPESAVKYRRNRCLGLGDQTPTYMAPVQPGGLLQIVSPQPPAEAPNPVLKDTDVVEPPLPSVAVRTPPSDTGNGSTAVPPTPPSGQPKVAVHIVLSHLVIFLATLLLF
ncbi:hypothetical protein RJ639_010079 [Escallonia herrerae]|uniref:glycerophosphodiester phosphodiesterase n=1 Tax=Escallonia herrerae TaxID=1293975 RepID=A0AA88VUQ1_9ASTE|nr:hypothetical protein RJ639_010079 [Escallonia herrerae]